MALKRTFFLSHGSPTLSIDDSLPARHFLQSWKRTVLTEKPSSILIISGHWEASCLTVSSESGVHQTIYDFYGFPKRMYELKYPAPRAPDLARRTKGLLEDSGFTVKEDAKRGLDHGAWVPLMLMYPECDVPVCQLSLNMNEDASYHCRVGKALAPLKEDGVLIIGSGSATHNLGTLRNGSTEIQPWASQFDGWLKDSLLQGRYEDVNHYLEKAPHARKAHPSEDHFLPLHVAMGASGEDSQARLVHNSWSSGTLSYSSYEFAEPDDTPLKI